MITEFTFSATVKVVAETKEDADIELLDLMDNHNIQWELESTKRKQRNMADEYGYNVS